ncbi:hypothetical protein H1R20_g16573, partial [Candolleomyces eurysporus]
MSSARLARSAFHAATRRATSSAPNAARAMGRRTMASSAEGAASKKSDTPWIVGSALVFGPAFLYLVSPSARKSAPAHHDKHDSKAHEHSPEPAKKEEAAAPAEKVTLKDDEGKEADVTASLALAEQSNVPKADVSPEQFEETKAKAEEGSAAPPAESSSSEASSEGRTDKSGTFQKPGSEGPTDQKVAEEAAQKGQPPKKQAEGEGVKPEEKS